MVDTMEKNKIVGIIATFGIVFFLISVGFSIEILALVVGLFALAYVALKLTGKKKK